MFDAEELAALINAIPMLGIGLAIMREDKYKDLMIAVKSLLIKEARISLGNLVRNKGRNLSQAEINILRAHRIIKDNGIPFKVGGAKIKG